MFLAAAYSGRWLLAPFGLDPETERLALEFWQPRVGGAPLGVALWAALGFFNGIGRPKITLAITVLVAVLNAIFNQLFIFEWGWGIAGSAWGTNAAQANPLDAEAQQVFAPGEGFVDFLPQFGLGAAGGWLAALLYVFALGTTLWLRWRSRAWQKIRL